MLRIGVDSSVEETVKEAVRKEDEKLLKDVLAAHPYILQLPLDDDNTVLLHLAATSRNPAILAMIMENEVDVNVQNKDGLTALHVAAMNGHALTLQFLLDEGGDPCIPDYEDMTPLNYAEEEGYSKCAEILKRTVQSREEDKEVEMSISEAFVRMYIDSEDQDSTIDDTDDDDVNSTLLHSPPTPSHTHHDLPLQDNTSPSSCRQGHDQESPLDNHISSCHTPKVELLTVNEPAKRTEGDGASSDGSSSSSSCASTPSQVTLPSPSLDSPSITNDELRDKLIELGEIPGPINEQTRAVYLKYLEKITSGIQPAGNKGYKGFKYELALCLNGTVSIPDLHRREYSLFSQFRVKGQSKEFFNYLLIDPTCLPSLDKTILTDQQNDDEMFRSFVEAVFYIGKGKNSRSFQHLKDAKRATSSQKNVAHKKSKKVERILDIWDHDEGILSLHVFNNIAAGEAYNREAAMIECIGLENLTNVVKGHYHGSMDSCTPAERRQLGLYFIHMSFKAFVVDTPQKIYPEDI